MNAYYDAAVDVLYLELGPRHPDGVVEVVRGVNLDTTSDNDIVGMEILEASQKLDVRGFLSAVSRIGETMPTICMFYGIKIEMFHNDHGYPHIHVVYGEHRAKYLINDVSLLEGYLPRRAQELVLLWMLEHRAELLENWERARSKKPLVKVAPLE